MEGVSGQSSQSTVDKSKVLDVKPLRTLVPMFPNPPQALPFVCSSPFGLFSSGFTPFYPFSTAQANDEYRNRDGAFVASASAVPLQSFETPQTDHHVAGATNGDPGSSTEASRDINFGDRVTSTKKRAKSSRKKPRVRKPNLSNVAGLPQPQREDGNRELVNFVMMKFDGVRRRFSQLEDSKETVPGLIKRTDLKAGNVMLTTGFRTNTRKRVGTVPGVEIGDIFYFRMELCVVGLHAPSMGGIDYLSVEEQPLAVSIVSSGGYDDNAEDQDVLIYTGQGKETSDQKLERGNLALEKSAGRANEIRVIRGVKDIANPAVKIYIYDGLYTIQDSWIDKGKSGTNMFKYKLVRLPGQPLGFGVWQSVLKWKESHASRAGMILPDFISGAENLPVSLVNDIDSEKSPPYFTYLRSVKYTKSFNLAEPSYGCKCRKNGGDFPYTTHGILVSRKPLLYECGPSCACIPNCKSLVSQTGLKVRLEVFKTKDKGWGLRSWDPIRCGTFICEYAGEVIDKGKYDRDDYIFDTSRTYEKFEWNYDPVLVGEEDASGDLRRSEDYDIPTPVVISAKDCGNVARFMNHSCSPNVLWQPIAYEQNGECSIHIAFFAMRHISPMSELTYDYGVSQFERRRKRCLCGSSRCKGYFG